MIIQPMQKEDDLTSIIVVILGIILIYIVLLVKAIVIEYHIIDPIVIDILSLILIFVILALIYSRIIIIEASVKGLFTRSNLKKFFLYHPLTPLQI